MSSAEYHLSLAATSDSRCERRHWPKAFTIGSCFYMVPQALFFFERIILILGAPCLQYLTILHQEWRCWTVLERPECTRRLRKIQNNPNKSQRELAKTLGFSLGKFNYVLSALKQKGLVKIKNFSKNPNKLNYMYYLTPKGFSEKTKLTINFMNRISKEYEELKKEIGRKKR